VLNGTQSVVCERYNEDSYGYWTWGEQQPFCQGLIIAKLNKKSIALTFIYLDLCWNHPIFITTLYIKV
jgi:hypothetical protein